ncbi:MAG TPA: DegT/DnrJ/EryC1/StrS family aminotransferase [Hyphomicrobiaceae bacterium]|nr:DegT/DnrJ/EryC1/StrS family aminotransferase [Hyphomicrobiaceae bacterium]
MKVPLFDVDLGQEEETAILETIRSKWLSTGPRTAAFEEAFAKAVGAQHAIAVSNGTAALHLALVGCDIGPGDEVIVPSLTFVATANAARYVGADVVFADVRDEQDLTIDPHAIEASITPRTKAIIVMHYAGFPCDMPAIVPLAARHGISIIEDACHGMLSTQEGRKLGTIGRVGCFSFFSNKNMTTAEGGMIVTDDAEISRKARLLRSHGMTTSSYDRSRGHASSYDVVGIGYNYRFDDLRASLGIVQLSKMPEDIARRAVIRAAYERLLSDLDEVVVPFTATSNESRANHIMPVVLRGADRSYRDHVRFELQALGVQTSVHYPPAHRLSTFSWAAGSLPITERLGDALITLPIFKRMTEEQVSYVVESLKTTLVQ